MADLIDDIINREGGYVDHPADRGGPTKYGITLTTLTEWRGEPVTPADVEALTIDEARRIYQARYIVRPRFNQIEDERLRAQIVDAAVLHGPYRAARWLQRAAGVTIDGVVGPQTLRAVNGADAGALGRRFAAHRIRKIGRILSADHSQAVFAAGWLNRATRFLLDERAFHLRGPAPARTVIRTTHEETGRVREPV